MYLRRIENNRQVIQAKHPAFDAKINLKSSGFAEYCEYLECCKDAPKGYFSSNRNIELFSKICKAFENHPSEEIIDAKVIYLNGYFNARGMVETRRGKIRDIEPSRSDDGNGPIEYLLRKLLDPNNKKIFNKLLGEEHSNIYSKWWNENIKPLWSEISDLYKIDTTIVDNLSEEKYNKLFRNQFHKKYYSPQRYKAVIEQDHQINKKKTETKSPFIERLKQACRILKGKV